MDQVLEAAVSTVFSIVAATLFVSGVCVNHIPPSIFRHATPLSVCVRKDQPLIIRDNRL